MLLTLLLACIGPGPTADTACDFQLELGDPMELSLTERAATRGIKACGHQGAVLCYSSSTRRHDPDPVMDARFNAEDNPTALLIAFDPGDLTEADIAASTTAFSCWGELIPWSIPDTAPPIFDDVAITLVP